MYDPLREIREAAMMRLQATWAAFVAAFNARVAAGAARKVNAA